MNPAQLTGYDTTNIMTIHASPPGTRAGSPTSFGATSHPPASQLILIPGPDHQARQQQQKHTRESPLRLSYDPDERPAGSLLPAPEPSVPNSPLVSWQGTEQGTPASADRGRKTPLTP